MSDTSMSEKRYSGKGPRMVLRKIRSGRVKILGHYYEPSREPVRDRHEGLRAAFGLYWGPPEISNYDERGLMSGVCLWGSEEMYRATDDDDFGQAWDENPWVEDSRFKWEWWHRVA